MAGDTLTELKERLLKTLVNQTPSPISNIQDIQLKVIIGLVDY